MTAPFEPLEWQVLGDAVVHHILGLREEIEFFDGAETRENGLGERESVEEYEKYCADAEVLLVKYWPERESEVL